MATSSINRVIQNIGRAVLIQNGAGLTDAELLSCFIDKRDEAAFEALLRRHGPMVLGVCRRVLRNHHDAEDAFQAAFLVLVRKAATIVPRTMVGNWLYGVAHTTALRARVATARRRADENQAMRVRQHEAVSQEEMDDLQAALFHELSCLPEKYRLPIVVCDLEGTTIKEAARNLGWPQGTLAGRLARARTMLAKRLTRHGVLLSSGTLAAALSESARASLPAALLASTVKAACAFASGESGTAKIVSANVLALTKGVIKAMMITKASVATLLLLTFGLVALSAGIGAYATQAAGPGKEPAEPGAKDDAPKKNMSSARELHVVERKQYQVECRLVKVDPWGRDLGADGKGKVLASPTIIVPEAKENVHRAGGEVAVTGLGDRPVEFLDFGVSFSVKITGMEDGRLRLDVALEDVALERSELPAAVQVYTRRVRRMAQTNLRDLGDEIKAVLKDDNGNALYWLGVKVVAEETITSRTRWDKKGPR